MSNFTNEARATLLDLARDDAEDSERLSSWEHSFLSNMFEQLAAYGSGLNISIGQAQVLHRIGKKYYT